MDDCPFCCVLVRFCLICVLYVVVAAEHKLAVRMRGLSVKGLTSSPTSRVSVERSTTHTWSTSADTCSTATLTPAPDKEGGMATTTARQLATAIKCCTVAQLFSPLLDILIKEVVNVRSATSERSSAKPGKIVSVEMLLL